MSDPDVERYVTLWERWNDALATWKKARNSLSYWRQHEHRYYYSRELGAEICGGCDKQREAETTLAYCEALKLQRGREAEEYLVILKQMKKSDPLFAAWR